MKGIRSVKKNFSAGKLVMLSGSLYDLMSSGCHLRHLQHLLMQQDPGRFEIRAPGQSWIHAVKLSDRCCILIPSVF